MPKRKAIKREPTVHTDDEGVDDGVGVKFEADEHVKAEPEYDADGDVKLEQESDDAEPDIKPDLDLEGDEGSDYAAKPPKRRKGANGANGKAKRRKPNQSGGDTKENTRAKRTTAGKKWTGDELEALFMAAATKSVPVGQFEGAVAGRTAQQCYMTWRHTLYPAIVKFVNERGGDKKE